MGLTYETNCRQDLAEKEDIATTQHVTQTATDSEGNRGGKGVSTYDPGCIRRATQGRR